MEEDSLWSKVLRKKYDVGEPIRGHPVHMQRSSFVWRSIRWSGELLGKGLGWRVKNGCRIRFWLDHWVENGPLKDLAVGQIPPKMQLTIVNEYWEEGDGWRWEDFANLLPNNLLPNNLSQTLLSWN